ncbi:hypothetical protein ANTHELSMS3_00681 [Antarctobacter heliothermus]|uniref:Uncharacterized protein n=1 Tax=Antarctobacter heliothermus TaxID=74033 RepID=A0A222DZP7_9RHOB|nr:hypothetical protein [Antarctobacter heliothermus]ASP19400.1 hypothetical protein ANTHELSMS3_00681 [Antarctobacter heliothermus]
MTRFLTATAIAALLGTGALAQTQLETSTIESFLPRVKVETLTDQQIQGLMVIAQGGDSESEKGLKMRGLVTEANLEAIDTVEIEVQTELTEAERAEIGRYAPELDIAMLSDIDIQRLQNAIDNGDNTEIETVVRDLMAN